MDGDFFEAEAIPVYMAWLRDMDNFGIYDYSKSGRTDYVFDSRVPASEVDYLQYDYCVVERLTGIDEREQVEVVTYLECKAKMFPRTNYKFRINENSWRGYKNHMELRKREVTFLFGNIMDGTIRSVNMVNENCFNVKSDGTFIDTMTCGSLLPEPYRIPQRKISLLLEKIGSVLHFRRQNSLW